MDDTVTLPMSPLPTAPPPQLSAVSKAADCWFAAHEWAPPSQVHGPLQPEHDELLGATSRMVCQALAVTGVVR